MNLNLNNDFEQVRSRYSSRVNSRTASHSFMKKLIVEEDQESKFNSMERDREQRGHEFLIRNLLSKPYYAAMFLKIQNEETAKQASEQNLEQQRKLAEITRLEESLKKELRKDLYSKDSSSCFNQQSEIKEMFKGPNNSVQSNLHQQSQMKEMFKGPNNSVQSNLHQKSEMKEMF